MKPVRGLTEPQQHYLRAMRHSGPQYASGPRMLRVYQNLRAMGFCELVEVEGIERFAITPAGEAALRAADEHLSVTAWRILRTLARTGPLPRTKAPGRVRSAEYELRARALVDFDDHNGAPDTITITARGRPRAETPETTP